MTQHIRYIGLSLLTVFTLSLVVQSTATAYHFQHLLHNDDQTITWFSNCQKDVISSSSKNDAATEITDQIPTQTDTKAAVNTHCHNGTQLLQATRITLYKPTAKYSFEDRIHHLRSQLFVSSITDPPQPIS